MVPTKVLILGAAGRDFHDFNMVFRQDPRYEVVAFTAAQIPFIEDRRYPSVLAGPLYPEGIPIYPETELESLIERHRIHEVVFAYSDVSHEEVMRMASRVVARGADFRLLGTRATMLRASKPVVSVCAVRTGAGKSPVSRTVVALLRDVGLRVAVVRHPMPYGDLARQVVQRFAALEDLQTAQCTIEEMEEYEPHVRQGTVVYAGVDYERILRQAEAEADVLVWDGGNNDVPFFESDLEIVLVDPLRPGSERAYFPGAVNLARADVVVLTKLDTADPAQVEAVRRRIRADNPDAALIDSEMPISLDDQEAIRGRRVLAIEDGPTLTHGGMSFGAATLAARRAEASECVDPRPYAVGSILAAFDRYPHMGPVLPAMGYSPRQIQELELTISRTPCDVVVIGTPIDLRRVVRIDRPTCRVTYEFRERGATTLREVLEPVIRTAKAQAA